MDFTELPEFQRDLKKLKKKFKSLGDDVERLRKILRERPDGIPGKHWNCITKTETMAVYKVRLACASLHEKKIRIIYAYTKEQTRISFIELYFKGGKENEDKARIRQYKKKFDSEYSN
jgi:hypothetical protein